MISLYKSHKTHYYTFFYTSKNLKLLLLLSSYTNSYKNLLYLTKDILLYTIPYQNFLIMSLHLHFHNTPPPTNDTNRPFVPSIAPEDIHKAIDIGILSPKSINKNDLTPKPFIKKLPT